MNFDVCPTCRKVLMKFEQDRTQFGMSVFHQKCLREFLAKATQRELAERAKAAKQAGGLWARIVEAFGWK